ncbi:MAG TPA: hypothetical protein VD864_13210, partial [Nocardioides sp.]|nr:hypothetical protein [Nocardioides sp.]
RQHLTTPSRGIAAAPVGTVLDMKLFRTAAAVGIAKKLYDESRKPANQARIKQAAQSVRERRSRKR